jgi:hypothetical protein
MGHINKLYSDSLARHTSEADTTQKIIETQAAWEWQK